MRIETAEELDTLTEQQLWAVAADKGNEPSLRFEAIRAWLRPDDGDEQARFELLQRRASRLDPAEVEEDDIEDFYRHGPYFDGAGRLIVEYDGVMYLVDTQE
ncbi:MAG: hypothetical protein IT323_06015 [Anaerolineae bacterium]|nr:hypothetical protein [Anaerolineae bacterium]